MAALIFWTLCGAVAWAFVGYPGLMFVRAWASRRRNPSAHATTPPQRVSVVLAARDEGSRIRARVCDLLCQAYPPELLEVLVVCNGCTDDTQAVAESIAALDHRVRVLTSPAGNGKTGALNVGVEQATGGIVVFTDARQRFDSQALQRLTAPLADPQVGAVTGRLVLANGGRPVLRGVARYWEWETRLRLAESMTGSVVGATGAIYAVRRDLIEPLPANLILDDVYLPLRVAMRGFRIVMAPDAVAYDDPSPSERTEYRRKLRTLVGNVQLVRLIPALLSPWRNPLFFRFLSHKLLRVLSPVCIAGIVTIGALLSGPIYGAIVAALLSFYVLGILGLAFRIPFFAMPSAFVLVQAAAMAALVRSRASASDVWAR